MKIKLAVFLSVSLQVILMNGCSSIEQGATILASDANVNEVESVPRKKTVAYFTHWAVSSGYRIPDAAASRIDHLIYSFIDVTESGKCQISPLEQKLPNGTTLAIQQLMDYKKNHPQIRISLALGGWTGSRNFSMMSSSAVSRQVFVESCVRLVKQWGFDGIDVDWEYPVEGGLDKIGKQPSDKKNFVLLLQEFRKQLNKSGIENPVLSAALPSSLYRLPNFDLKAITEYVDWITLMSYDYQTEASIQTGHHAALYPAEQRPDQPSTQVVISYLKKTAELQVFLLSKFLMGVPFYGRGWNKIKSTSLGLYQPTSGKAVDHFEVSYQEIVNKFLTQSSRSTDPVAQSPWLYNKSTKTFISYEDPLSLQIKARYAHDQQLGGVAIWEISQDDLNLSLLKSVSAEK